MFDNNTIAIESFITFCDDMMIAEEGFKDIGKTILNAINKVWQWFLKILKKAKDKIKSLFKKNKGEEGEKKDPKEIKAQINTNEKKIKELEDEIKRLKSGKEESDRDRDQYRAQSEGKDTRIKNLQHSNQSSSDRIKELESEVDRLTERTKEMANSLNHAIDASNNYRRFERLLSSAQADLRSYANSLLHEGKYFVKATDSCIKVIGEIHRGDDSHIPRVKNMLEWNDEDTLDYRDRCNDSFKGVKELASTRMMLASALYRDAISIVDKQKVFLEKAKRNIETMEKMIEPMKNDTAKYQKAVTLLQLSGKYFDAITKETSRFTSMTIY